MPGLIDCHIHLLNMWTAKDEATMAADIANELPKRLNAFLAAGVTTVKSVGDSEDDILRVRQMLSERRPRSVRVCMRPGQPSPLLTAIRRQPSLGKTHGCATGRSSKPIRRRRLEKR